MKAEQIFVVVHIVDGVVNTVATNNKNIIVIIADEDDNNEQPASISEFESDGLFIVDTPLSVFNEPEGYESKSDKEIRESFLQQLYEITEDKQYFEGLAEELKNTDGFIRATTANPARFISTFEKINPFMKIELQECKGYDSWNLYNIIVKSGG